MGPWAHPVSAVDYPRVLIEHRARVREERGPNARDLR